MKNLAFNFRNLIIIVDIYHADSQPSVYELAYLPTVPLLEAKKRMILSCVPVFAAIFV